MPQFAYAPAIGLAQQQQSKENFASIANAIP